MILKNISISILIFLLLAQFKTFAHPFTPCNETTGMADIYPCEKTDLMRRLHIDVIGGSSGDSGSDIWGWTDPDTGIEYAIVTMSYGTVFVELSDPKNPIYLGKLPSATSNSIWRDVKTYNNYAFIVSEAGGHGMQIFDLTQLRNIVNPPIDFTSTAHYNGFGNAHNIVINESTGYAFAVGTGTCSGGLHMVNIQNPINPINAGCFSADGYTHDAQCVSYIGPDSTYVGKEICFNSNEDTLTIVDVTTKSNPLQISRSGYSGSQYTHQGWLTDDQRYYLMNDELDEQRNGHNTKTYIWDLLNLTAPQLIGFFNGPKASIDHNLYIKGNYAYMTNYTSGLRVVDISDIGNANLTEVASFDGYPNDDSATFNGAWSNYPYFDSGIVIMSDFQGGLFVLKPDLCPIVAATTGLNALANGDNTIELSWINNLNPDEAYSVFRSEGGCDVDNFDEIAIGISNNTFIDTTASGGVKIGYKISKTTNPAGTCQSERSVCVETQTTGMCTVAPLFSGISSVTTDQNNNCGMNLNWQSANGYCSNDIRYNIYKSTDPAFIANDNNRVALEVSGNTWHDILVNDDTQYYYLIRSVDKSNQAQDSNNVKLADIAHGQLVNGDWSAGAEIGDLGFGQNRHVGWELSTSRVHSGNRSYWSQNQSNTCNDLLTQSIHLSAGENSQLSFWTAYDIESRYDGGVVEVTNNNNQFNSVILSPNGYPSTFNNGNDACDYATGTPSFSGTDLTWKQHTVDLSSYQGQDIKIRWNYSSDGGVNNAGWFLDDITVTNTQVPSQCNTLSDAIYSSGFD